MPPPDHTTCALHDNVTDGLQHMDAKLDTILQRLSDGAVTFATMDHRISALAARVERLEQVCFGAIAVILIAVMGAAMTLVIKS